MPNPKRRHSKRRTSTRRAHDHLSKPASGEVSALPRNEAAAPGLPALWLLQGQGGQRGFRLVRPELPALLYSGFDRRSEPGRRQCPMITIAVDAMGGDNAPRPEVEGSVLAARELGVRVMLVGQPQAIRAELARHDRSGLAD